MHPTERFSSRVADYVRYRPSYPEGLIDVLTRAGALTPASTIADIGSGTGLLTRLFLHHQHPVYGIEPNAEMRRAGEAELYNFPTFTSVAATAEATTLPDRSVDLVVAGQAFHWFDQAAARMEFQRILRAPRWAALIWNERLVNASPFLQGYEDLLRLYSTDYTKVDHRQITPEVIAAFFAPTPYTCAKLPNRQVFDFEGLRGRLLSSSYAPPAGHPSHAPLLAALRTVFDAHERDGNVAFEYETVIYLGTL